MKRWQFHLCAALLALNLAFIWGNSMLPADLSAQFSDFVQSLLVGVTAGMIVLLLGQSMLKTQKKREQHHFGG